MDHPKINKTAEPFFVPAGKTGHLLVHGFTSTPKEMQKSGKREIKSESPHWGSGLPVM